MTFLEYFLKFFKVSILIRLKGHVQDEGGPAEMCVCVYVCMHAFVVVCVSVCPKSCFIHGFLVIRTGLLSNQLFNVTQSDIILLPH
jgi:hypothetical protein